MKPHSTSPLRSRRVFAFWRPAARGLALAGLLILAGCMVGPDYHAPATKTPESWTSLSLAPNITETQGTLSIAPNDTVGNLSTFANATAISLVAPTNITIVNWWTTFNDQELNHLIQEAANRNLTVLQTMAAVRQARATVNVVSGSFWPSANGSGSYQFGASNGGATGINTYQLGGNALWNLDVFGGVRRQIESAEASLQAAMENRNDALVTLEAQIGTTYLDLRTAQYLLQIAHTNLDIQNHTVDITQQRFNGGFVSRLDVENALAQADNTLAEIPSIEAEARTDIYVLSVLLGKEPSALLEELDATGPMLQAPAEIPIGLPSDLLRRRPDIRAAEAQLHAATANIGVAISALFPQFSLTSSLQFQAGSLGQLLKWANSSWTVGPTVNWQIFAAGSIIANVHLQEAGQLSAFYNYKSTVLTAFQQVETALTAFYKEQERSAALRQSVVDNQKATDLSTELYKEGNTEFLNVLTAESGLFNSQQQLAVSEQAVSADLITLYQSLGGGWSAFPEQNAEPLPFPQFPYGSSRTPLLPPGSK
jgi:NodT family efflux transporter outer membrane factor (OMF) lipoprotein